MPSIASVSIYVDDMNAAVDFYTRQLGFKVASRPAPVIVELESTGLSLVLCQAERRVTQSYPDGTGTVLGLVTLDAAADAARLENAKADLVIKTPEAFPAGRFIAVRDPAGNVVELLEFLR